jgi:hypothetical protein
MLRVLLAATLFAALTFGAQPAYAENDPVRLEYTASPGCPDASVLRAEVQKRLKNGRLAREGELARAFRIHIDVTPERALAHMDFVDADGREAKRDVSAPSCDEALRAIALVAALAIEARAEKAQAQAGATPRPSPRPTGAPRGGHAEPPTPITRALPRQAPERPLFRFGFGPMLGANSGFAPKPALELALALELRTDDALFAGWAAIADSGPTDAQGGTAKYRLYTLGAEGCPVALRAGAGFALRPCLGLDAGLVHAAGEKGGPIDTPNSTTEPWISALVLGRVELAPDPRLVLVLQGGPGFPLIRQQFTIDLQHREQDVYDVPQLIWRVGVGLLARFE